VVWVVREVEDVGEEFGRKRGETIDLSDKESALQA
jgi:hypothetical protein